jgi:hypothetical protein
VFLRDQVFPDVNKFNEALRLVQASHPTGVNDDNIMSMAIALHLGETKRMDYQFKSYDHTKWANFAAWKILSIAPKFRPPSPTSTIMNDPSDATTVDPTAPANSGGGHHHPVLPSVNHHAVPPTVSLLPRVAETPMSASVLTEPTNIPRAGSGSLSISTTELYLHCSEQARKEVEAMSPPKLFPFSSNSNTPLTNFDPSKGGRGAAMGNKKAKAEYNRQQAEMAKNKTLESIENSLKKQAKQNAEAHQVFKLRQMIKLAKTLQNKRLLQKVEKEIELMLGPDDEEETTTSASGKNFDDDDENDDSIPPSSLLGI